VETFSGGTEATAFNPRAVAALRRAGFSIQQGFGGNPIYKVGPMLGDYAWECFSKKFDDQANPQSNFMAIMTCSEADKACPLVPGADFRAGLTYLDPKLSDGTAAEAQTYDERCMQIGAEMYYLFSKVSASLR
jgi:arsenate reductase